MKKYFNLLIFISFLFLFIYLIRQDFIIPEIQNPVCLVFSVGLLFMGFLASVLSWKVAMKAHGISCPSHIAMVSHGLSVFAKYIPGKVWVILGRASYVSRSKSDLKLLTFISFKEQLIYLWVGFAISVIPTVLFYGLHWISILSFLVLTGLTLFLFVEGVHRWGLQWVRRITRRNLDIPVISFSRSGNMIGAVLLIWICWTIGFFLFMKAFSNHITADMMFAFPLSVCLGLIAIILPGGLGLREGIIIGYLVLAGLDIETSTTISFMNRIWFILGEVFMFLTAFVFRLSRSKRN
jgi:glycosyltransferase 2 family protein